MKDQIVQDALVESRDHKTRLIMVILSVIALVSMTAAVFAAHKAWRTAEQRAAVGQTLAAQVKQACSEGGITSPELVVICKQAAKIEKIAGYPVSWTFTIEDSSWYCDDEDNDHIYICVLVE